MIRRLFDRFYPHDSFGSYNVFLTGIDNSGKTTLLYHLKAGDAPNTNTIPTMGLNIETVKASTAKGISFTMTVVDLDLGFLCAPGNWEIVRNQARDKLAWANAVIWVVDISDPELFWESLEAFEQMIRLQNQSSGSEVMEIPILLLANKCDRGGNHLSPDRILSKAQEIAPGRNMAVFKTFTPVTTSTTNPAIANTDGELPQALNWLLQALQSPPSLKIKHRIDSDTNIDTRRKLLPPTSSDSEKKLDSWLARADTDSSPEEFLIQFQSYTLPSWDHYTHIRIAYVILTTYGRQEGKNLIFDGIERYIANGGGTHPGGRTFHITMTYFWVQMVHFGIRNMPPLLDSSSSANSSTTVVDTSSETPNDAALYTPSPNEYARFLLLNPYLSNGNLWSEYYSKETMMTPKAKGEMVLPDKKPLPNIVMRDAISTSGGGKTH